MRERELEGKLKEDSEGDIEIGRAVITKIRINKKYIYILIREHQSKTQEYANEGKKVVVNLDLVGQDAIEGGKKIT
jgi:hypothetical protein